MRPLIFPKGLLFASLLSLPLLIGCGEGSPPAHGERPAGGQGGHPGDGGRPAMPAIAVAVENPARGEISTYYTATATLDPSKEAEVVARVSGVVLQIVAEEGDFVSEKALLLRIDDREYRHRLSQTEAEVSRQQARYSRVQKMIEGDLVSAEEFEGAKSDIQSAEANKGLASLQLSYTRVQAPFTGRVIERFVDPGRMVSDGTPLFRMADVSRLLARVHVPAREFRNIRTDQMVELLVDSSDEILKGEIILVSPIIDPSTGTIKVTVQITEYPESIRPGDFAEVRIVTDNHANTLIVPKIAVISEKGEEFIYLAVDSQAVRRIVEVGFQDETNAEILSGLTGGESIIVQGHRSLREGQPVHILEPMKFDSPAPGRDDS